MQFLNYRKGGRITSYSKCGRGPRPSPTRTGKSIMLRKGSKKCLHGRSRDRGVGRQYLSLSRTPATSLQGRRRTTPLPEKRCLVPRLEECWRRSAEFRAPNARVSATGLRTTLRVGINVVLAGTARTQQHGLARWRNARCVKLEIVLLKGRVERAVC